MMDMGSCFTKVNFAGNIGGESVSIESIIGVDTHPNITDATMDKYVGAKAVENRMLKISHLIERGSIKQWNEMVDFFAHIADV